MEGLEGRETAGRQDPNPGRGQPREQCCGASRVGRRSHRALRGPGGARERHRGHRLRAWIARASADRVGETEGAIGRRGAGEQAALGALGDRWLTRAAHHGMRPASLKYPPEGPSSPMVAYSTAATAPWAAVLGPLFPFISVAQ